MRPPDFIPSAPLLRLASLGSRRKPVFPNLFPLARHALLSYLQYQSLVQGRTIRRMLVPDSMCGEVVEALRGCGVQPIFYPLDPQWDVSLQTLESLWQTQPELDALLLTHFYGKVARQSLEIARRCRQRNILLLEDCVHLPFPYLAPAAGDVQLYSLRKVYPVPYGATILLREEQKAFDDFVRGQREHRYPPTREWVVWLVKQMGKQILHHLSLGYPLSYRDLSADPLRPFTCLQPWWIRNLSLADFPRAVTRRRENYQRYTEYEAVFSAWGEILPFDLERDVPYAFVLTLRESLEPLGVVRWLRQQGIPAALGLALDREVLPQLAVAHPYRRVILLPLHQDVRPAQIRYVARVFEGH